MDRRQHEKYTKLQTVGSGTFGVAHVVLAQSTKQVYVMKQIDLNFMDDNEKSEAFREAKLLEILRHPNIIEFNEVFKTKSGKLCIVMELGENGDL